MKTHRKLVQLSLEKNDNGFTVGTGISLRNKLTYTADIDITGDIGSVTRLENLFSKGFDRRLSELEEKLTRTQTDLQEALAAKGKPFEHAEELAEKSARLEQLNRELEVRQVGEVIMNESEDEVQDGSPLYQLGYENALKEGAVDLDTEKLRADLGNIKGIGESRLNEIMSVFEKLISGEPH